MKEIINQQEIEKKWERDAILESVYNNGEVIQLHCVVNVLTHQVVNCDVIFRHNLDVLQSEHIVLDDVHYEVFAEDDEKLNDIANIFTPTFWY